jgi:hypothetical protein
MTTRQASCSCGQLRVVVTGDPVRVSVCHCLACQRRTGSAFGYQARFVRTGTTVSGRSTEWTRDSDDGAATYTQHFCPDCGATVYYVSDEDSAHIAVPVGAFADPSFDPPQRSVWESRRHGWVGLPDDLIHEHDDEPATAPPSDG